MSRKVRKNKSNRGSREQCETEATAEPDAKIGSANTKSRRGFASMDQTRRRQLASRGGLTAQALGLAHRFDSDSARQAGRKGGSSVSADRNHMAELGRRGGLAKSEARKKKREGEVEPEKLTDGSRSEPLPYDGEGAADVAQQESGAQLAQSRFVEIASPVQQRPSTGRHRKGTQGRGDRQV